MTPHAPVIVGTLNFPSMLIVTIILSRRRYRVRVVLLLIVTLLVSGSQGRRRGWVVVPPVPAVPHAAVVSLLRPVGQVHPPLGHFKS